MGKVKQTYLSWQWLLLFSISGGSRALWNITRDCHCKSYLSQLPKTSYAQHGLVSQFQKLCSLLKIESTVFECWTINVMDSRDVNHGPLWEGLLPEILNKYLWANVKGGIRTFLFIPRFYWSTCSKDWLQLDCSGRKWSLVSFPL